MENDALFADGGRGLIPTCDKPSPYHGQARTNTVPKSAAYCHPYSVLRSSLRTHWYHKQGSCYAPPYKTSSVHKNWRKVTGNWNQPKLLLQSVSGPPTLQETAVQEEGHCGINKGWAKQKCW
jgi:hypothetical protein